MTALDFEDAEKVLRDARSWYARTHLGRGTWPGMGTQLDRLLVRLERGERTAELYDDIMAWWRWTSRQT